MTGQSNRVIPTQKLTLDERGSALSLSEALKPVASGVANGDLVVFPTETVYGLGVNPYIQASVERVYTIKGRPCDNPLILHIASMDGLSELVDVVRDEWWDLAHRFWPGPMTFVCPKASRVPLWVTGGRDTVGVRFPSHPVAQALISRCGVPLAAPSANRSGKPSLTRGAHLEELDGDVEWILDCGELDFGLESTIIALTGDHPRLLRPGPVTLEQLYQIIPDLEIGSASQEALAPGMKYRHYAPQAKLFLEEQEEGLQSDLLGLVKRIIARFEQLDCPDKPVVVICTDETQRMYLSQGITCISMGSRSNPLSIARKLFHVLRLVDELGYPFGIVEGVEESGIGFAIMNRIRKAVDG